MKTKRKKFIRGQAVMLSKKGTRRWGDKGIGVCLGVGRDLSSPYVVIKWKATDKTSAFTSAYEPSEVVHAIKR